MKDSFGTFYHADGTKHIGQWANDKYNGQGIFTLPNGNRYEGGDKDGRRNGNGTVYIGSIFYWVELFDNKITDENRTKCLNYSAYKESLIYGTISLNYSDPNIYFSKYVGEFVDDVFHGQGVFEWFGGAQYEGSFKNGSRHRYGVYYCEAGTKCMGQSGHGSLHGVVVCQYKNGDRFEGTYKNYC